MQILEVRAQAGAYNIHLGVQVLEMAGEIICQVRRPTRVAVVTNPIVGQRHQARLLQSLETEGLAARVITMRAGERNKNLAAVVKLYEAFFDMGLDRNGAVIALGGGVVGDVAGFAASTYMRGVDLYQAPTSLLAQVDSSVGGKTGVDLPRGKNLVGTFYPPKAVLADVGTLRTLPVKELRSGMAEVIKHGVIRDAEYFGFVRSIGQSLTARHEDDLTAVVSRSIEIKREVVERDEKEAGLRAILNFGHTIGHAIEALTDYSRYRHGEAISIGMVTESLLAEQLSVASKGTAFEVANTLLGYRLPIEMDPRLKAEDLVGAMEGDKKSVGGKIRMALPTKIGDCVVVEDMSREALVKAIETHRRWDGFSDWQELV